MVSSSSTINKAFANVRQQHRELKEATTEALRAYTAILKRAAEDKPRKTDVTDLTALAEELGYSKLEVEADLRDVQRLLSHRQAIIDGENAWREVCELRAKIVKKERLHEQGIKELEGKKQSLEQMSRAKNRAPTAMSVSGHQFSAILATVTEVNGQRSVTI